MTGERRHAERRAPAAGEPLARLRLRTGRELTVIDIAARGALVEGPRLMPGAEIDIHIVTTAGRALVRGRVLRCAVSRVSADAICYRSGLAFEQSIEVGAGYPVPAAEKQPVVGQGSRYPPAEPARDAGRSRPVTA